MFNFRAAGRSEGSRQLVTRKQFAAHDVLVQYTVMNQCTGVPSIHVSSFLLL